MIPRKYDFIEVIGAVKNPGRYPYDDDRSITNYIDLAGGITTHASKRYHLIQSSTGDRTRIKGKELKYYDLKSQDIIFVEEKKVNVFWNAFNDGVRVISQILTIIAVIFNISQP